MTDKLEKQFADPTNSAEKDFKIMRKLQQKDGTLQKMQKTLETEVYL